MVENPEAPRAAGPCSRHRTGRAWLDVPFTDKDAAKALGARWDPQAKRWYDPRSPTPGLERWAAVAEVPDLLPGEDRGFESGLFVDMIPSSCWFTHVRSCVTPRDWDRLRRLITRRADRRCEGCGAGEDCEVGRWLEAHERFAYDERAGVQSLRRLICLCSSCHQATHFGLRHRHRSGRRGVRAPAGGDGDELRGSRPARRGRRSAVDPAVRPGLGA
ncbi:hypothetical protein GCM10009609_47890 [Pseudonocardia aurantiaca]|uniref:DUF5710 domain-containing protein n=1 Tax=Pseudonocardia aurantiaca TaxID=75290 RepID=A0ABW4FXU9_9PSEU